MALQLLLEGSAAGESCLYITLAETEGELRAERPRMVGRSTRSISSNSSPRKACSTKIKQQSLLYSSDLELGETTQRIFEAVEKYKPSRVVLDSLSKIRLLAQNSLRYRRQVLALKHYFAKHNTTVLLLDDLTVEVNDKTVHSIAHGVIRLDGLTPTMAMSAGGCE